MRKSLHSIYYVLSSSQGKRQLEKPQQTPKVFVKFLLFIFNWNHYKVDISVKRTLSPCIDVVHFIEIPLCNSNEYIALG